MLNTWEEFVFQKTCLQELKRFRAIIYRPDGPHVAASRLVFGRGPSVTLDGFLRDTLARSRSSVLSKHSEIIFYFVYSPRAGALDPEIKSVRGSLTGASEHRIDFGIGGGGNLGSRRSSSRFGSIRNIKVSSTLFRQVHFPRQSCCEEAK